MKGEVRSKGRVFSLPLTRDTKGTKRVDELFLSLSSPVQGELEEQTLGESQTPADADTKAPYGGYCTIA